MQKTILGVISGAMLVGCGSSMEPASSSKTIAADACTPFPFGVVEVTSSYSAVSCVDCGVTNAEASADGDKETFATLKATAAAIGMSATIRATNKDGRIFPADMPLGALYGFEKTASVETDFSVLVRTFLNDEMQEEVVETRNTGTINGVGGDGGPNSMHTFRASKPFDAIEFGVEGSAHGVKVNLYEFCG